MPLGICIVTLINLLRLLLVMTSDGQVQPTNEDGSQDGG